MIKETIEKDKYKKKMIGRMDVSYEDQYLDKQQHIHSSSQKTQHKSQDVNLQKGNGKKKSQKKGKNTEQQDHYRSNLESSQEEQSDHQSKYHTQINQVNVINVNNNFTNNIVNNFGANQNQSTHSYTSELPMIQKKKNHQDVYRQMNKSNQDNIIPNKMGNVNIQLIPLTYQHSQENTERGSLRESSRSGHRNLEGAIQFLSPTPVESGSAINERFKQVVNQIGQQQTVQHMQNSNLKSNMSSRLERLDSNGEKLVDVNHLQMDQIQRGSLQDSMSRNTNAAKRAHPVSSKNNIKDRSFNQNIVQVHQLEDEYQSLNSSQKSIKLNMGNNYNTQGQHSQHSFLQPVVSRKEFHQVFSPKQQANRDFQKQNYLRGQSQGRNNPARRFVSQNTEKDLLNDSREMDQNQNNGRNLQTLQSIQSLQSIQQSRAQDQYSSRQKPNRRIKLQELGKTPTSIRQNDVNITPSMSNFNNNMFLNDESGGLPSQHYITPNQQTYIRNSQSRTNDSRRLTASSPHNFNDLNVINSFSNNPSQGSIDGGSSLPRQRLILSPITTQRVQYGREGIGSLASEGRGSNTTTNAATQGIRFHRQPRDDVPGSIQSQKNTTLTGRINNRFGSNHNIHDYDRDSPSNISGDNLQQAPAQNLNPAQRSISLNQRHLRRQNASLNRNVSITGNNQVLTKQQSIQGILDESVNKNNSYQLQQYQLSHAYQQPHVPEKMNSTHQQKIPLKQMRNMKIQVQSSNLQTNVKQNSDSQYKLPDCFLNNGQESRHKTNRLKKQLVQQYNR